MPKAAQPPRIRIMEFSETSLEERDVTDPHELTPYLESPSITWVDVQGLGDESVLRALGTVFGLHPLALEDVVNVPQRPKVEQYDKYLLFITHMVRVVSPTQIETEQLSLFLGDQYVLTFQERYGDVFDPVRARIRREGGTTRKLGHDYLAYTLLDAVMDAYFPVLERTGDFIEALEEEVIESPRRSVMHRIYRARRELLTLRRVIWPQREAISGLLREENDFIGATARLHLRDTYDHCIQIIDVLENYRELLGGLMDVYLSSVGNRQNEVMKVLTVMASIFIPLTFLVGIYGMNFDFQPELHFRWGYPILLGVMTLLAAGMLLYFRRLGWIGGERDPDADDGET